MNLRDYQRSISNSREQTALNVLMETGHRWHFRNAFQLHVFCQKFFMQYTRVDIEPGLQLVSNNKTDSFR